MNQPIQNNTGPSDEAIIRGVLSILVAEVGTPSTSPIVNFGNGIRKLDAAFASFNASHATLTKQLAAMRQCASSLAVFAKAYRSHPKRNPSDALDATLAQFEAINHDPR